MGTTKKRKKTISNIEKQRRERQAKIWHKATHPNEEYEKAEKMRRKQTIDGNYNEDYILPLN